MSKKNPPKGHDQQLSRRERAKAAAQTPKRTLWPFALAGIGLLCAAIVGVAVWATALPEAWKEGIVEYDYTAAEHTTEPVDYKESPPVGGPHDGQWLNCGIYRTPVEETLAVHSLEHGAVWVTHRPDIDAGVLAQLAERTQSNRYLLVSPLEGQTEDLVASAWNRQLRIPDGNMEYLDSFIRTYSAGPQTPEPGAPCWGGQGAPGT